LRYYKKIFSYSILALLLLATFSIIPTACKSSINKEAAIQILLNEVIKPGSLDHDLIAFSLDEPLSAGTEIAPYAPDPLPEGVNELPYLVPETMRDSTWFFWVDDSPRARFSHPTRFVYINATDGTVSISQSGWWPYIDREVVSDWVDDESRWDTDNWAYSNISTNDIRSEIASLEIPDIVQPLYWDTESTLTALSFTESPDNITRPALAPPAGEAIVVVNGWNPGQTLKDTLAHDIANAAGFSSGAQIPRYLPQGETEEDITGAIQRAVDGGATNIFFYFTGHGARTDEFGGSYLVFKDYIIRQDELVEMFQGFSSVRFKVVLDACYSGGFGDALLNSCKVDIFISSSRGDEVSWGDLDAGDDNEEDTGSEFSSGLWEDLNEINESSEKQQRASSFASKNEKSEFVGWLAQAYGSAVAKDQAVERGLTHPQSRLKQDDCPPVPETPPLATGPDTSVVELEVEYSGDVDLDTFGNQDYLEITFDAEVLTETYYISNMEFAIDDEVIWDSGYLAEFTYAGEVVVEWNDDWQVEEATIEFVVTTSDSISHREQEPLIEFLPEEVPQPSTVLLDYTDGTFDGFSAHLTDGQFATCFTAEDSSQVTAMEFYIIDNPAPFKVRIYDKDRALIKEISVNPEGTGWQRVELPESIAVKGDFYVSIIYTTDDAPLIGRDSTNPQGQSWVIDPDGTWAPWSEKAKEFDLPDGEFGIRVEVIPQ